jgi:hypothetical protein
LHVVGTLTPIGREVNGSGVVEDQAEGVPVS